MSTLPPELLLDIIDSLVRSNPSHAARIPNLAALARVNRTFYSLANPLLYRTLFLDTSRRLKILSTLASRTDLAREVRTLTISGGELSVGEYEFLKEVLSTCSNISSLTYLCFDSWFLPSFTSYIAKMRWAHDLRYLRTDSKTGLYELLCRLPNLEELVAARIDFPLPLPLSPDAAQAPTSPPQARPSFRLKRFDSGSSPLASEFDALTATSRSSLNDLDIPISSKSPLPNLSPFSALSHLTLTLAERYIPHNLDSRVGTQGAPVRGDRDDVKCLRRVKAVLRTIEATTSARDRPLRRLELYQPDYKRTREFSSDDIEEAELLEAIPGSVAELDLSTVQLSASYLLKVFGRRGAQHERIDAPCCRGLRTLWLKGTGEGREEVERCLKERAISVIWVF
ncbi:hypothetical protein JCM3766R1_006722 [Sporobolomyces carnicolor]